MRIESEPMFDPEVNNNDREKRSVTVVMVLASFLQILLLLSVSMAANWKSPSDSRSTPVAVGEVAPDFTLEDQNRNKVTLSAVRGKSPVVLVFYRGYW